MTMNKVCLIGKIIKDVEVKMTKTDKAYATFSLGVPRNYKLKGARYAEQDMIACRVWGDMAERLARYTSKGDWISIVGAIRVDKYVKDGEQRSIVYVNCDELYFLRSHGASWSTGVASRQDVQANSNTGNTFDDMGEQVDVGSLDW